MNAKMEYRMELKNFEILPNEVQDSDGTYLENTLVLVSHHGLSDEEYDELAALFGGDHPLARSGDGGCFLDSVTILPNTVVLYLESCLGSDKPECVFIDAQKDLHLHFTIKRNKGEASEDFSISSLKKPEATGNYYIRLYRPSERGIQSIEFQSESHALITEYRAW